MVIVCAVPFGMGNLANLEAAREAFYAGRKVLLANSPPIEERDFTAGEASRMFRELISLGAQVFEDSSQVWNLLPSLSGRGNVETDR